MFVVVALLLYYTRFCCKCFTFSVLSDLAARQPYYIHICTHTYSPYTHMCAVDVFMCAYM